MTEILQSLEGHAAGYRVYYCDLWGCLHNGERPFPAAVAALEAFRAKGGRVVLLTNSPRPERDVVRQLDGMGVPRACWDLVVSSGDAAQDAMAAFGEREIPLQVAVMGWVVNGPGEARDADLGIAAGNKRGHLFVKGQNVMVVPEDEMVDTLVEWAEYIHEHGADAALERASATKDSARKAAEEDRDRNLGEPGDDANDSETIIKEIRRTSGSS